MIKLFFRFLARNIPELMQLNARIQAIRKKPTDRKPPPSMTVTEVEAILGTVDPDTLLGARNRALLKTMYNTGARVQELADLTIADVRFDAPATVTLTGKGRKTRVIPLWDDTLEAINCYIKWRQREAIKSDHLFINVKGEPLTRFGIDRIVEKYAGEAARQCPSLCGRTITPTRLPPYYRTAPVRSHQRSRNRQRLAGARRYQDRESVHRSECQT